MGSKTADKQFTLNSLVSQIGKLGIALGKTLMKFLWWATVKERRVSRKDIQRSNSRLCVQNRVERSWASKGISWRRNQRCTQNRYWQKFGIRSYWLRTNLRLRGIFTNCNCASSKEKTGRNGALEPLEPYQVLLDPLPMKAGTLQKCRRQERSHYFRLCQLNI